MGIGMRNGLYLAACIFGGGLWAPSGVLAAAETAARADVPPSASSTTADEPRGEENAIALAEARGHELWLVDQAAWRATDALRSDGAFDRMPEGKQPRGWLTTRLDMSGLHWLVAFLAAPPDAKPVVWAEVEVRFDDDVQTQVRLLDPWRELSSAEATQREAVDVAHRAGINTCTENINTAVLLERDESDRPRFQVYFLSASTQDAIIAGGHTRVTLEGEPPEVAARFEQTKSCVTLPMPGRGNDPSATPAVTHLTSATPTEIHVFLSRTFDVPLYVMTASNRGLWHIKEGRIRSVEPDDESGTPAADEGDADTKSAQDANRR